VAERVAGCGFVVVAVGGGVGQTGFSGEGGATTLSCVTGRMGAAIGGACTTLGSGTGVKGEGIGRLVARQRICAI
jgi:hypothetical protein